MAPRYLELRHVWGCHPLWDPAADHDLAPDELDLPPSVVARLDAWAARWDGTFDVDRPERPRVERFVIEELGRDGARLWRALLGLLPPTRYRLAYVHGGTTYRAVDELPPEWRFG